MKKNKYLAVLVLLLTLLSFSSCGDYQEPQPPEKYNVTIELDYEKVFLTSNTPMNVYVNDEKIGRQEAGTIETYTMSLEEGKYLFYLKNDGIYKTDVIEFNVTPDNCAFSFGAKTRLTFGVEVWSE